MDPPSREALRRTSPSHRFASVDDLVNRSGIRREELQTLADIGAFASFGYERREALWQIEKAIRPAGELFRPEIDSQQSTIDSQESTTNSPALVFALKAALERLNAEGHDNSRDARSAIADALEASGLRVDRPKPVRDLTIASDLTAEDLRRLASADQVVVCQDPAADKRDLLQHTTAAGRHSLLRRSQRCPSVACPS